MAGMALCVAGAKIMSASDDGNHHKMAPESRRQGGSKGMRKLRSSVEFANLMDPIAI